ncbi:hypothetical protein BDP67DRAFT_569303 [Colletotrichum lupini]|nr:hypothetical protein BDP67DRAFT_569303 [Colletotrichum lupini]
MIVSQLFRRVNIVVVVFVVLSRHEAQTSALVRGVAFARLDVVVLGLTWSLPECSFFITHFEPFENDLCCPGVRATQRHLIEPSFSSVLTEFATERATLAAVVCSARLKSVKTFGS